MLSRIFIQNFALIDQLEIDLGKGLQVLTGETGAGKSIILGALRLIMGERADAKSFSKPDSKSIVETEFIIDEKLQGFFEENDLDFEKHTIIRREIAPGGKSRAFVNDVPVTLDILKNLSSQLIDIHSQFETSNLFTEEFQFGIIDGLAQNQTLVADYQSKFALYQNTKKEIEKLKNQLQENNKETDYKAYLLNELTEADLDNIDFEDLQSQLSLHENSGAISENLSQMLIRFDQEEIGILDGLQDIRSKFSRLCDLSHHFHPLNQRFEETFLELKDILFEIQNEAEKIEINPEVLAHLNQTVNKIQGLMVKHQVNTVAELIQIREELSSQHNSLEAIEQTIAEQEKALIKLEKDLEQLAQKLHDSRKKHAKTLEKKAQEIFGKLGLEKALLQLELTIANQFNLFGKNHVQILFQANAGFPLKPIQTAVSGGERSRVMLAIKKIMAENKALPTLILDEIDTGVSGRIAEEMGNLMQEIANNMQLIVITHLAQVAAKGNENYKVMKFEENNITKSTIVKLSDGEKLTEIAQLISGSKITEAALNQARELIG